MNPWGKFVRKTVCPAHYHVLGRTTLAIGGPIPVAAHRGFKFTKIANELNKRGVMTKRKKRFNIESVKYILGNHIYYGESNFGDIKSKGVHEPIISRRLFVKVGKSLKCNIESSSQ